eukprot:s5632_g6.t1
MRLLVQDLSLKLTHSPIAPPDHTGDPPSSATATKNFFKAQTVTMKWNNVGTAVLVKSAMEVDDTGKSYYGGANLYFLRADGEETALVASADGGPIHDAQWSPTQDEFILLHGELPCPAGLYEGRKGNKRVDFGSGHRNTIRWNPFGRFFVLGGYGQLLGDTDFWDKPGKQLMASRRMECCVVCGWAPDGRHFLTATTAPRMRVDNKIELFDYLGSRLGKLEFDELLLAGWRPRPRGAFQDRAPSPGRSAPASQAASTIWKFSEQAISRMSLQFWDIALDAGVTFVDGDFNRGLKPMQDMLDQALARRVANLQPIYHNTPEGDCIHVITLLPEDSGLVARQTPPEVQPRDLRLRENDLDWHRPCIIHWTNTKESRRAGRARAPVAEAKGAAPAPVGRQH